MTEWNDNWADDSVFYHSGKESKEFKQNGLNALAEIKSEPLSIATSFNTLKKSVADWICVVLNAKKLAK